MKNIMMFVMLAIPILASAQNDAEAMLVSMSKEVERSSCSSPFEYKELFSLAFSGVYKGASSTEWLSEINEKAFFKCPERFLKSLSSLSAKEQDQVLGYFGIVNPPWDIAEALHPYENNHELSAFVNAKLSGFKNVPKP